MFRRQTLGLLPAILFCQEQGLYIYKYENVRIPYIEVTETKGKRHFVYANLLIRERRKTFILDTAQNNGNNFFLG